MSRDGSRNTADLIFLGFVRIVGKIHPSYIDIFIGGVVEFNPVVAFEVLVDVDPIGSANLIDTYGGQSLVLAFCRCERLETGFHFKVALVLGELEHRIGDHCLTGTGTDGREKLTIPKEVAGGSLVVVYLNGNDIRTVLEEVWRQVEGAFVGDGIGICTGV